MYLGFRNMQEKLENVFLKDYDWKKIRKLKIEF